MIQTVDFFPPIVDTPREFGQIAAANSLSDIYAMGAQPLTALNIVGFPRKQLDGDVLGEILAGGADKMREAEVALLGGHTVEDGEVKYGLSVSGIVDKDKLLTNGGAQVGDRLVLSKPLGMGAVSTSIQKGKEDPDHAAAAIRTMAELNAGAARALRKVDCHAVTDITGFGLMGHGSEVARASGVSLRFRAADLPLTPGARELAEAGVLSGGTARGRSFLKDNSQVGEGVSRAIADIAYDAETSGGLLMAVPEQDTDTLIQALQDEGTPCAVEIGHVEAAQGDLWVFLD